MYIIAVDANAMDIGKDREVVHGGSLQAICHIIRSMKFAA